MDGVLDENDKCPTTAGALSLGGCPDTDGDGVPDYLDFCPNVFGSAQINGCPDSDNDGISDSIDLCPNLKGFVSLKGCPDLDGDGILENVDECPKLYGIARLNGCPEVTLEHQKILQASSKQIQFESDKHTLKPSSFKALDQVAEIMINNRDYKLFITSHTEVLASPDFNLELSEKKAKAIQNYLKSKGIEPSRVHSSAKGDPKPFPDNTKGEQFKNSRVELLLFF